MAPLSCGRRSVRLPNADDVRGGPQPKTTAPDRSVWFVVAAGVVYLATVLSSAWLMRVVFGFPVRVTPADLREHLLSLFSASVALQLPPLALILLAWLQDPHGQFRASIRRESALAVLLAVLATALAKIVLNNLGAWPFTWRWEGDPARLYASVLVTGAEWGAVVLWSLLASILIPCIEEAVFRFGLLQAIRRVTGSAVAGVMLSSLLFGVVHLGPMPLQRGHLVNAIWLTLVAVVLATVTVRRSGNITISVAVHAALNTLGMLFLFWSVA